MQEICPREKCTGCAACYNVCPKNCIQMKENEYGEVQPFIVEKKKSLIRMPLSCRSDVLEKQMFRTIHIKIWLWKLLLR